MERRRFITQGMAAGASLVLPQGASAQAKGAKEPVIVIGAGMAGIAAARELQDRGHPVTILEGRERIGGRVWTSKKWKDTPMDLGASWIHGTRGNPLTKLAKAAGAKTVATDSDEWPVHDSAGKLLESFDTFASKTWLQIERTLEAASKRQEDQSVLRAIEARTPMAEMDNATREQFRFLLNSQIEQDCADDVSRLSVKRLSEGESFGGGDVILPGGYAAIPEHMAKGLDIRLNETVRSIEWKTEAVKVVTHKSEHIASRVIITLPIGVLQKGAAKFDPPLPQEKRDAISQIGAGVLNKLCLKFPKVFWQQNTDWIGSVSEKPGEFCDWLSLHRTTKQPVLVGFNSGSFGRSIEQWEDAKIVAEAMKVLRRIYGTKIPDPSGVQITRWASDPFALCSYSSPVVGMTRSSRDQLAKPVGGKLFFAGEATHPDHPSTVHGALLSGQRAAKEVLKA